MVVKMNKHRQDIRQFIRESSSLPTLPGIITKIIKLESQKNTSTADMALVISSDQILSAKVLRLVNSPFYGFSRRVSTISNALILLGINVIKSLVLSCSIFEMMEKNFIGLWEHSLATAAAANIIATHLNLKDIEEVSTAALLHDIGKVVITIHMESDYADLLDLINKKDCSAYSAERELLQTDHAEVGQWLADCWFLPEKLLEPIAYHHDVQASKKYRTTTAVIHYADILAKIRGVGFSGDNLIPEIQSAARNALNIDIRMMKSIIKEFEIRLIDVRNFSMDIQNSEDENA